MAEVCQCALDRKSATVVPRKKGSRTQYGFDSRQPRLGATGVALRVDLALVRLRRCFFLRRTRRHKLVNETSTRMHLSFKQVWLLKSPAANALACMTTRDLVFTSGLLENLTDEEVKAVCSHEMGHLKESRATVYWRLAGAYAFLPLLFLRPLEHTFDLVGPLVAFAFVSSCSLLFKRFACRLEVRADKAGKDNETQEGGYARALERIYQVKHMPAVVPGKNAVHPHLYDRLVAAGLTPAYPRPKAPGEVGAQTLILIALAVITGLIVLCAHS